MSACILLICDYNLVLLLDFSIKGLQELENQLENQGWIDVPVLGDPYGVFSM